MTIFKIHVQPYSLVIDKADLPTDDALYEVRNQLDTMMGVLSNGVEYLGSSGKTTSYKVDDNDVTIGSVIQAIGNFNLTISNNISVLTEFYPD
jgi:hypothetical protein